MTALTKSSLGDKEHVSLNLDAANVDEFHPEPHFDPDHESFIPPPTYVYQPPEKPLPKEDGSEKHVNPVKADPATLAKGLFYAGPHGLHDEHSPWVPIIPVDRSLHKITHLSRGAGYRLSSLVGMHYLTAALRHLEPRIDDDFTDRLNYYYSSTIILVFAILVSAKQYVGHPIECWVPAQFTKAMEQYTENYCWVQNTYWVPFQDLIPSRMDDREKRQIGYYQWVPFILALQALMFYIPATVWRLLNTQSGINLRGILELACSEQNLEPSNRTRCVQILSRHIDDALRYQRDFGAKNKHVYLGSFIRVGKFYGAYVTILYGISKVLYLLNVFGQFFLLNKFLGTDDYPLFGGHVLWDLLLGVEWRDSGKFPRVTLCDFQIRELGNIHRHTVQCVLVINMFTEKIFIFLWLWFLFLTVCTLANLVFWLVTIITPQLRLRFILKCLELSDEAPDRENDRKMLHRFVEIFLRPDGVFLLRMVASHSGNILCTELTYSLWQRFRETHRMPHLEKQESVSSASTIRFPDKTDKSLTSTSGSDDDLGSKSPSMIDYTSTEPEVEEIKKNHTGEEPWTKTPVLSNQKPKSGGPLRLGSAIGAKQMEANPGTSPADIEEYGIAQYV